jgi:hypothetical protein
MSGRIAVPLDFFTAAPVEGRYYRDALCWFQYIAPFHVNAVIILRLGTICVLSEGQGL